jgi:hypothetical protein
MIIPTLAPRTPRAATNCHNSVAAANQSRPTAAIATPVCSSTSP